MRKNAQLFTPLHRGLHWWAALLMFVLFITGFLRMNWMSKKVVKAAIDDKMAGVQYTPEQAMAVAKAVLKPMWQWHEYAAYFFFAVLFIRIVYMLVKGVRFPNPFSSGITLKQRLQGSVYLLFYLFVVLSSVTGAYLKWFKGDWKEPIEAIHKWGMYWFPIFILFHFVGIWMAEKTYQQKGITSKMIGGDDE